MDRDQEKKDRLKKLKGMVSYSNYIENRLAMDFVYSLNDFLDSQQAEITKLKSDLIEMAEAYCYGSTNVSLRLKAIQIIESK